MSFDIEIGKTYEIGVKGLVSTIVGVVNGLTDNYVIVETYDYYHEIKRELVKNANPVTLEPAPESKLAILLRQNYVRVPTQAMADELTTEAETLGYTHLLERVELCDMACGGNGVTYFLQIFAD